MNPQLWQAVIQGNIKKIIFILKSNKYNQYKVEFLDKRYNLFVIIHLLIYKKNI